MNKRYMILAGLLSASLTHAQELHSSLQLRNSHLWRGIEVASGLVYTADAYVSYKKVYAGFWSGGTANGGYKEFNNFIGYKDKKLTLEYWDIYNFSPNAPYNNREFFNYKASQTGRFGDFRSNYTISAKFPLTLSWNTVVFGRDRNAENTENKYSTFVSAEYPLMKKDDIELKGRLGYSFALNQVVGEESNFFAHKAGMNEISLLLTKKFEFAGYTFPLGLWSMWNPVDNHAFLQLSVQVYSF